MSKCLRYAICFWKEPQIYSCESNIIISSRNEVEIKEIGDNFWRLFRGRFRGKARKGIMVNRCISLYVPENNPAVTFWNDWNQLIF